MILYVLKCVGVQFDSVRELFGDFQAILCDFPWIFLHSITFDVSVDIIHNRIEMITHRADVETAAHKICRYCDHGYTICDGNYELSSPSDEPAHQLSCISRCEHIKWQKPRRCVVFTNRNAKKSINEHHDQSGHMEKEI